MHGHGLPPMVIEYMDSLMSAVNATRLGPKEIARAVEKEFFDDAHLGILCNRDARKKLERKVMTRISNNRRPKNVKPDSRSFATGGDRGAGCMVVYTNDLMNFKNEFTLRLPSDYSPRMLSGAESHIVEWAKAIAVRNHLGIVARGNLPYVAHRNLLVLPYPSVKEQPEMDRVYRVSSTRREPAPENTMVFSSLALLSTLCDCKGGLDMRVVGSIDATDSLFCNNYKLIMFGVIDVSVHNQGLSTATTKAFRPLGYAVGQGEREDIALLLVLTIKKAARDLFGLDDIEFEKGGIVSDHSTPLTNALKRAFPRALLAQCYPHIIRKFRTDGREAGNGEYANYCVEKRFIAQVAVHDVRNLHRCRTRAMFETMAKLVILAWKAAGEEKLASVFSKSYLDDDTFNKWNYTCFGSVGLVPQNNSIERSNLDMKGSRQFAGILKTGVSIDTAIKEELPRMVYTHSVERVGAKMEYAILSSTCIDTECIDSFRKIVMDKDTKEYEGGYLVNTAGYEGVPVDAVRIQNYERALQGIFPGTYLERHLLVEYTEGLCHVIQTRLSSGQTCFVGSCEQFYKRTYCPHAVLFMYKGILPTRAHKIPTKRSGRKAAIAKGTALSRDVRTPTPTSSYSPLQLAQYEDMNDLMAWLLTSPPIRSSRVLKVDGERRQHLHEFCERLIISGQCEEGRCLLHTDETTTDNGDCLRVTIIRSAADANTHPSTAETASYPAAAT